MSPNSHLALTPTLALTLTLTRTLTLTPNPNPNPNPSPSPNRCGAGMPRACLLLDGLLATLRWLAWAAAWYSSANTLTLTLTLPNPNPSRVWA